MQKIYKTTILLLCLITCSICIFQGCGNKNNKNTLVLGTSLDYPPFESSQNGEAIGFDIDIAKALTQEMGYQLEIKDIDFSGLIPALISGRVDFVMSGMSETEERKKNIDFSSSYYGDEKDVLLHLKDKKVYSFQDVNDKKIGAQLGSIQEAHLKEMKKTMPNLEIISLTKNQNLIQEVKIGRIHSLLISEIQAKKFIEANPELAYSEIENTSLPGIAIGFKKNSPLTPKFNDALKKLETNGTLEKLKTKWFN